MLLNCNQGCKNGTTTASYDRDTGEVICDTCSDVLQNVSSFAKNNFKLSGPYAKKKKKSFQFRCNTCSSDVQADVCDGRIVGLDCKKDCNLNISSMMKNTLLEIIPKSKQEI